MLNPKFHLMKTLKSYRAQFGLSLDQAARKTGVSKAMLGQIERGESSPTAATLWKIATGLEVSLSSFLEPMPAAEFGLTIRSADALRRSPADEGMLIAPVFPFDPRLGYEFFEITFMPGYERFSEPHQQGVVEQVSIVNGSMEIFAENAWHSLHEGQSIRFAADQKHGYRNNTQEKTIIHNIIHYPKQP